MASTPRQTETQSDQDRPFRVPGPSRPSLPRLSPLARRASGVVLLRGTCLGPRLSWEGGVASHWPQGKDPRGRAVGGTEVKEAQGVGRGSRPGPGRGTSHVPEGLSLGLSQAPGPATCVLLRPRGGVPCVLQEGTQHAQIQCSTRPGHLASATLRIWSSHVGLWSQLAPCSRSSPDILTRGGAVRPCFLGFQPLVLALQHFQICPLHSADSSWNQLALSHLSHFFPLLEFDSNSPQNRICTKVATLNLDLHKPLCFVLFVFFF